METRKLRAGAGTLDLTVLGFGGAPLGNLYEPIAEADADATLDAAWKGGIRIFDTAPFYGFGLSEERFGARPVEAPAQGMRALDQDRPRPARLPPGRGAGTCLSSTCRTAISTSTIPTMA